MTSLLTNQFSRTMIASVAISTIVANLIVKLLIERFLAVGESWWLIDDAIGLERIENRGIAFGIEVGSGVMVAMVVLAALLALVWLMGSGMISQSRLAVIAAGMVLGGALGNALDRLLDGSVTDYIALWGWPRFNIADAALTVGLGTLLFVEIRASRQAND